MDKLQELTEIYGFEDPLNFLEDYITDSICPGICENEECDYTTEVEPDCTSGWCEECQSNTVVSGMILAGII